MYIRVLSTDFISGQCKFDFYAIGNLKTTAIN